MNLFTVPVLSIAESIADKLDHTWENQEQSLGEKKHVISKNQTSKIQNHTSKIKQSHPSQKKLNEIKNNLKMIEASVDNLLNEVIKSYQIEQLRSEKPGLTDLMVHLYNNEVSILNHLMIELDQHLIYEADDLTEPWKTEKSIKIFSGYLTPGVHRIDIQAKIQNHQNKNSDQQSLLQSIKNRFTIDVPEKSDKKTWVIGLYLPENDQSLLRSEITEKNR